MARLDLQVEKRIHESENRKTESEKMEPESLSSGDTVANGPTPWRSIRVLATG